MIQEIVQANCGILFDYDAFERRRIPITIGQHPHPPSEDKGKGAGEPVRENNQADAIDVVQPIHDRLEKVPEWWLLEIIPTSYTYQNEQNKWVTHWR